MRFIVFGVGSVGGTVAACLARSGREVVGIARGGQLAMIRDKGLLLRTPDGDSHVHFDCYESPADFGLREDDAILICVKSQHTEAALASLRLAGALHQPICCLQNGVANERMALRHFPNVYGVTVMMPCAYHEPGVVHAFGTPRSGIFDVGRFPSGNDDVAEQLAEGFEAANIAAFVSDDVMASKYGKLMFNLSNVLAAAFPDGESRRKWVEAAKAEAVATYEAAGIAWQDVGPNDARRADLLRPGEIDGVQRLGNSSQQSILRDTGSIETDYLNGEIVLLGRLHGVPTPVNVAATRIGQKLIDGRIGLGQVTDAQFEAELTA